MVLLPNINTYTPIWEKGAPLVKTLWSATLSIIAISIFTIITANNYISFAQTYDCRPYDNDPGAPGTPNPSYNPDCSLYNAGRECDTPNYMVPVSWSSSCFRASVAGQLPKCICPDTPTQDYNYFNSDGTDCACEMCLEINTTIDGNGCDTIPCCPYEGTFREDLYEDPTNQTDIVCDPTANRCRLQERSICDPDADSCITNTECIEQPGFGVFRCTQIAGASIPPSPSPTNIWGNIDFEGITITTQLGNLPFLGGGSDRAIVSWVIAASLGLGGGLAVLMIIYGGYILMFSGGDPYKTKEGKEILTAAITGLIFIAASVTLLKILGQTILGIDVPGV